MGEEKKRTAREIIENYDGAAVRIMEVCGTHTHEIFRLGIRKLLPPQVELISGPGCPVCVTPVSFIDEAIYLALEKQVTICTFGDLVRVPGTKMSLAGAREQGAKIHVVYSPADAEKYAKEAKKLRKYINEEMYDEETGFYYDVQTNEDGSEKKLLDTAASVSVITDKDLDKMHINNLDEALILKNKFPNAQIIEFINSDAKILLIFHILQYLS